MVMATILLEAMAVMATIFLEAMVVMHETIRLEAMVNPFGGNGGHPWRL